jgi:tetratricopeptide (TPR) repeat protein
MKDEVKMKRSMIMAFLVITGIASVAIGALAGTQVSQYPESLKQAKDISNQQKKPILMEFFRPDCFYCELSTREAATKDTMKTALQAVVHFPVDVKSDMGKPLVAPYFVGDTYPVFILTDSTGEVISRWTGYSNAALFAMSLNKALADMTTIKQRYDRLDRSPSYDDALYLAKYNEEIDESLEAIKMYRLAQSLNKSSTQDYSYYIFQNTAVAAWNGKIPFEKVTIEADKILATRPKDKVVIPRMVRTMTNLARKTGRTADIGKYLQAGIDLASGSDDQLMKDQRAGFVADRDLYIDHDTTRAVSVRKGGLGDGWENKPDKYYTFAKWCLERQIDLDEAETYAKKAVDVATPGKFRAGVFSTLAGIYDARGKLQDAVATLTKATQDDPENDFYPAKLDSLNTKLNK